MKDYNISEALRSLLTSKQTFSRSDMDAFRQSRQEIMLEAEKISSSLAFVFSLNSTDFKAAFLAITKIETGSFRSAKELPGSKGSDSYFSRYTGKLWNDTVPVISAPQKWADYSNRAKYYNLHNRVVPDAVRFRGAGPIQATGRYLAEYALFLLNRDPSTSEEASALSALMTAHESEGLSQAAPFFFHYQVEGITPSSESTALEEETFDASVIKEQLKKMLEDDLLSRYEVEAIITDNRYQAVLTYSWFLTKGVRVILQNWESEPEFKAGDRLIQKINPNADRSLPKSDYRLIYQKELSRVNSSI